MWPENRERALPRAAVEYPRVRRIMTAVRMMVTGGAGFIGSNFIRYWLERYLDDSIINLDLLTYAGDRQSLTDVEEQHSERYLFKQGDIADLAFVDDLIVAERPDVVVNFAAESHNSRAIAGAASFVRTNIVGTHTLLDVVRHREVGRFHHVSTCEVYGDLALDSADAFAEDAPYRPRTPYNASKAAADHLVRAYHLTHGLPVTISNCANNYGPWQHPEKMIPLFTTNLIDDLPIPLYRQSVNRREWLYVEDHCRAIDLILKRGRLGETYNVGSGVERSIEEVADALLALLDRPSSMKRYVDDRPGHDRRYLLNAQKIKRELGWEPTVDFAEGLRLTAAWYRDHRSWWEEKRIEARASIDEFQWRARAETGAR